MLEIFILGVSGGLNFLVKVVLMGLIGGCKMGSKTNFMIDLFLVHWYFGCEWWFEFFL